MPETPRTWTLEEFALPNIVKRVPADAERFYVPSGCMVFSNDPKFGGNPRVSRMGRMVSGYRHDGWAEWVGAAYRRWGRIGVLVGRPADEFWKRLLTTPTGCWEWTAACTDGYGWVKWEGKRWRAHRLAWHLACGPIPDGALLCHHCDNRPCCNPSHLYVGTRDDNARDAQERGRLRPRVGAKNGMAKLSDGQVLEIHKRASTGEARDAIALDFGIAVQTVGGIVRGDSRVALLRAHGLLGDE